jgi:hypothetical protein
MALISIDEPHRRRCDLDGHWSWIYIHEVQSFLGPGTSIEEAGRNVWEERPPDASQTESTLFLFPPGVLFEIMKMLPYTN